jgi:hypothetical protein
MDRVTADTVRQLAAAVGIRPEEGRLAELAGALGALLGAIERCDELNLVEHEPATIFRLTGGPTDAEL